jgi:hypothetical protein
VSSSPSPHRRAHLPQPGLKGLETARLGNCVTPTAPHNHLSARTACACISTQAQLNHTQVVLERQGAKWLPCQGLAVAGAVSLHNRNHRTFAYLEHLTGRRGATAAHTAKERLPVGTPLSGDKPLHSPTRTAVQQTSGTVPTSPRQQLTANAEKRSAGFSERVESMAFRPRRINEFEDDHVHQSSASLASIVKSQPAYGNTNRSWRPMQASDLGEARNTDIDGSSRSTDADVCNDVAAGSEFRGPFLDRKFSPGPLASLLSGRLQPRHIDGDVINVENTARIVRASDMVINQGEAPSSAEATRMRLFGNLPDLTRLSEQVGEFYGQVVFVGHPNGDTSAHQWSSSPFEWVNLGRYSHSRGKVEGSLASDRLRGIDEPRNTIEYFKLVAENRQALVFENSPSKNQDTVAEPSLRGGIGIVRQPHVLQGASVKTFRIAGQAQSGVGSSLHPTTHTVLAKDVLEDPFVTAASVALARSTNDSRFQPNAVNSTGSLDLTYRFLTKTSADISSVANLSALSLNTAVSTFGLSSRSGLQEVAFGEEAATRRWSSLTQDGRLQQTSSNTSYRPFHEHSQDSTTGKESRLATPWYKDVTSDVERSKPATRPVAPTRPVLSTNHISSSLNAAAAPYSQPPAGGGVTETSESTARTANAPDIVLQYSDPDGLRKTQQYEVANGLTQQAPTPQNFKGPFFTDSKPTTHDPTASLSVHVSEEEKLINWFRDGQRPARQKEYTKSLIAAAVARDKSRHPGAIGVASAKSENGPYANTGPFVRLYENLSEYVEDHRNGGGQSYFTRRWKPAAPQLREPGPEQSRSYFGKSSARPSWPGATMLRPSDRVWG